LVWRPLLLSDFRYREDTEEGSLPIVSESMDEKDKKKLKRTRHFPPKRTYELGKGDSTPKATHRDNNYLPKDELGEGL
jgi:hypothetical protein